MSQTRKPVETLIVILDTQQIVFLISSSGIRALERAAHLPPDRLTRLQKLRRDHAASEAAGVVELLELRTRARAKFAQADRMFFTPEGLEQATGETISAYRAERFPADTPILDACCGVGGDALALHTRGRVLAVDYNPCVAACARANADAVAQTEAAPVNVLCADVTRLDLARLKRQGVGAAFFDPSRRVSTGQGRARARNAEDYLPPLSWLDALAAHFPFVGVKVSPAIDDDALAHYVSEAHARVEFIAEGNECKEAVLWLGEATKTLLSPQSADTPAVPDFAPALPSYASPATTDASYCATIVRKGMASVTLWPSGESYIPITPPGAWLYEPNPAIIRAHLTAQVAQAVGGAQMDAHIAYLTAEAFVPTPFATAYRILDWMPYHPKNLLTWLRAHKRRVEVVKKRGVLLEPDEVRKKLSAPALAGNPPLVLVLMRRGEQILALLCDPPVTG